MKSIRSTILVLSLLFLGGLLAACTGAVETPPPPTPLSPTALPSTPSPEVAGEFTLEALAALDPLDILLQKDYEPTFFRIETMVPYGRVPSFTLFADGTVIYRLEGQTFEEEALLQARLTPEETVEMVNLALEAGLGRLESHTDFCQDQPDGTQMCLADAAFTILRGWLPSGELHEVKIYAEFANDTQAFETLGRMLEDYQHPDAVRYQPQAATLFVSPLMGEPTGEVYEWPFGPELLQRADPEQPWPTYLEGQELADFMAGLPRNMGDFYYEHEGRQYRVYLVPWLPGVDYRGAIQADFPATTPAPATYGQFSACPIPVEPGPETPSGLLRLAYTAEGQLWVYDEGQEPVALAEGEDIEQVLLAPGGQTIVFTLQAEDGAGQIWAVDTDGERLRSLTEAAELTGRVSALSFSEDGELLAFTHEVKEGSSELVVAELDGTGARRLITVEELRAIFKDFPNPQGVIPFSVQWVPGTHQLTYDAFPTGDGIYIYVQDQAHLVDADTGQKRVLLPPGEGGSITYSPDGETMAILRIDSISLAPVGGGQQQEVDVPYLAIGFGEYYYYPPVVWAPDSRSLLLALPGSQDYSQAGPVTVWNVPVDGEPARLAEFAGFAPSFIFSPDLARLAYWTAPEGSNDRQLHLANVDGSEDVVYVTGFIAEFQGWAPDSHHFVYTLGQGESLQTMLGDICGAPVSLAEFHAYPLWLETGRFLLVREREGQLEVMLADMEGEATLLLSPEDYDSYAYTLLPGE